MEEKLLSIQEAAKRLKVSTKTLRRWEAKGVLIPSRTSGAHRRYPELQILDFAAKLKAAKSRPAQPTPYQSLPIQTSSDSTLTQIVPAILQQPVQQSPSISQPVTTDVSYKPIPNGAGISTFNDSVDGEKNEVSATNYPSFSTTVDLLMQPVRKSGNFIVPFATFSNGLKVGFASIVLLSGIGITVALLNGDGNKAAEKGSVLATTSRTIKGFLNVNVPSYFNDFVNIRGDFEVNGRSNFNGDVFLNGERLEVTGDVIASNLVYSVAAGEGIAVTGDQNITLTNTGVTSLQGENGELELIAGSGIAIDGLTISSTISEGSDPDTFKTVSDGTNSFSAGSSSDTLTIVGGTGISLSTDTTNKKITINNTSTGTVTGVGDGLALSSGIVSVALLSSQDGSGSTSSYSGLEIAGGSDELSLLQGCGNGEILKFNSGTNVWECAADSGGASGIIIVEENDTQVSAAAGTLDFLGNDFALTESPVGEINVVIDYANSEITRNNQDETISGNWTFSSATPITFSNASASIGIANTGSLVISDGSNSLLTIADGGTQANVTGINNLSASGTITLGTVSTGTWNGTAIASQYGGTGQNFSGSTGVPSLSSGTWSVNPTLSSSLGGTGQDFSGSTGVISVSGGTFSALSQLTTALGGLGANVTAAGAGELLYSTSTTTYDSLAAGNSGECLVSGGTGAPSWLTCPSSGGGGYFTQSAGSLFPVNSTVDFLIGGTSSSSAKFAVLNVSEGTPVASVSAGTSGSTYITASGQLATSAFQQLTIGGGNTGNILLSPKSGGNVTSNSDLNLTTGNSFQINGADVLASTTLGSTVINSSLQTVGTITSGTWNGAAVASQYGGTGQDFSGSTGVTTLSSGTWSVSAQLSAQRGGTGIDTSGSTGVPSVSGGTWSVNSTLGSSLGGTGQDFSGSTGVVSVSGGTFSALSQLTTALGGLGANITAAGGGELLYSTGTTTYDSLPAGNSGFCLTSGGTGAPVWTSCAGATGITTYWDQLNGALTPKNTTVDLLIGGTSTDAAKFAILGVNNVRGSQSATLSGSLTLDAQGSIQTTSNQQLTLGGSSTGDVSISPRGGSGILNLDISSSGGLFVNGVAGITDGTPQCVTTTNGIVTGTGACQLGSEQWVVANGALYTGNPSLDLLLGGVTTESAKFAVTNISGGTPTATLSAGLAGGTYLTADGVLATTNNQTLTLGNGTTGNINFFNSSNRLTPTGALNLASTITANTTNTINGLSISSGAITSGTWNGTVISSQYGGTGQDFSGSSGVLTVSGGIFSSSASLATSLGGLGGSVSAVGGGEILYSTGATTYDSLVAGNSGECLTSGGTGAPVWTDCEAATGITTYWDLVSGALTPKNSTVDLLLGGTTTESAKFALTNIASGTPVATISANNGDIATYISGDGTLSTTNSQTLTLGGSSTGDIVFDPGSGNVRFADLATCTALETVNGLLTCGTDDGGISSYDNFWQYNSSTGIIAQGNLTTDLLIGSTATDSAKFAIVGVAGARGTQIATLSGSLTLDSEANIQTTQNQTLTIGGGTSGNLILGRSGKDITFANISTCTALETVNGVLTCGTDDTGISSYDNFWQYAASTGVIAQGNLTTDVLFGSTATDSAKFAFLNIAQARGNQIASISGSIVLDSSASIQTTQNQTLTLGGDTTGNINFFNSSNRLTPAGALTLASTINANTTNTINGLSISSGTITSGTWNGTAISSQYGGTGQDFSVSSGVLTVSGGTFSASASLATSLGGLGADITAAGGGELLYSTGTTTYDSLAAGVSGQCLTSGGTGSPVWTSCAGATGIASYWQLNSGSLSPVNNTLDILIGGQTSESAKFAVLNVSNGTPIASVSAGTNGAAFITADGSIQTTANQSLSIGGGNSGDIVIGQSGKGITLPNFVGQNGILYGSFGTGLLSQATTSTSGQCLVSGGSNPTWSDCAGATGITTYWDLVSGALTPKNSTLDLLLGGTSTTSSRIAFINVDSGTPTASVSAGTNGATYIAADGTLATTANQSLRIGNNTTGDIEFYNSDNRINSNGNLYLDGSISIGSTPSLTGAVRLANNTSINFRDSGNLGDNVGLSLDDNDIWQIADGNIQVGLATSAVTITGTTLELSGIPTTDPTNSDQIWSDNGVLVLSGFSAPENYWQLNSNLLTPANSTFDFGIGGTSTDTAKFAVLNIASGTPTASISANSTDNAVFITGSGNLATTNSQTLTLGGVSTGDIVLDAGTGNIRLADLGTCTSLETVGGLLTCGTDDGGVSSYDNFWQYNSSTGIIAQGNLTTDLLIGSTATDSAKFAILGVAGARGTQTATLSGNLTLDSAGSIQTTQNQTLTLGGSSTGNIVLDPISGDGIVSSTGSFNLASGKEYLINGTSVLSSTTLGTNVVSSSLTSVGTLTSGTWNADVIATAYGGLGADVTAAGGGEILYSTGATTYDSLAAGNSGECLTSGGTGAPVWADCSSAANDDWDVLNGAITPKLTSTLDLLIGGVTTDSAKFAIIGVNDARGSQVATLSGSLTLDAAGTIQTTLGQTLTIGGGASGNLILGKSGKDITFANIATCTALETVNGILTCGTDDTGISSYDNFWQYNSTTGVVAQGNLTTDLLLGSTATSSAKFAVLNIAGGTPVASVSAGSAGAAYLTASGKLATTARQTLALGDISSTGNIVINPGWSTSGGFSTFINGGDGGLGLGGSVTIAAGAGDGDGGNVNIHAGTGTGGSTEGNINIGTTTSTGGINIGTDTSTAIITIGRSSTTDLSLNDANWSISGAGAGSLASLNVNTGGITNAGAVSGVTTTQLNGVTYTWPASATANYVLLSGNTGSSSTLSWIDPSTLGTNYWDLANGALNAKNSTVDLLLGGTSTEAAKFAVLNINSGTPTASISASSGDIATYITGGGTLSTTNSQTLTLGGTSTGDIVLDAGTGNIRLADLGTCTSLETVSGLLTCGTDDTGITSYDNFWQYNTSTGVVSNGNLTTDLLLGSTATSSARFAVLNIAGGTPTASVSAGINGGTFFDATGNIQTTALQTLTIGGGNTGNIVLTPSETITLGGTVQGFTLGGNITGTGTPDISGLGTVSGNVFQGTTSVTFGQASQTTAITGSSVSISNLGTNGFVKTSGGTGLLSISTTVDAGSEISGFLPFANGGSQWTQDNTLGSLSPRNNTLDLLYGGATTDSAKFAILGIADTRGAQTASLSGSLTLDAAGSIQTTNNQTLTIGGGATGDLILGRSGKDITFANIATCTALETVNGILTCGTDDTGITSYDNFWQYNSSTGVLSQGNLTTDVLFGATSTASARFAFLNVNSGTPTASISAGIGNVATFLSGSGTLATTARADLNLGSSIGGQVILNGGTEGNASGGLLTVGRGVNSALAGGSITLTGGTGSFAGSGTGGAINLIGGNAGVVDGSGGSISIQGGDGATDGSIDIGTLSASGNINIGTSNSDAVITIGRSSTTDLALNDANWSISGAGAASLASLNVNTGGITNAGAISGVSTTQLNGVTYTWPASATANYVLLSGNTGSSSTLSWIDPSTLGTNYWDLANGALNTKNSTVDLLLGGTSTEAAKFAVLNINSGTPTASISAGSGDIATYITGDGTLSTTNSQTLTLGGTSTGDIVLDAGTGNIRLADLGTCTSLETVGGLLTCGTDETGISSYDNFWQYNSSTGIIANGNLTTDLLIGSTSTDSAKFAILGVAGARGTQTATLSGNLTLDSAGVIQTTQNQSLTLGGDTTGNLLLNSDGNNYVGIGTSTPLSTLDVNGTVRFSNPSDIADYFTITSGSTVTTLGRTTNGGTLGNVTIDSAGTLTAENLTGTSSLTVSAFNTDGGLIYADSSGLFAQLETGTDGQCLLSNTGAAPEWGSCDGAGSVNTFEFASGTVRTTNQTVDLLIGGVSTEAAKFAITNIVGSRGTQVATLSGSLVLDAAGSLQTTNKQQLTIGGDTTGDIYFRPGNNANNLFLRGANVGIGNQNPQAALDVSSASFLSAPVNKIIWGSIGTTMGMLGYDGSLANEIRIGSTSDVGLELITNDTIAAYISNTGNFGIGTTAPSALLDVAGAASVSGQLTLYGTSTIQSDEFQTLNIGGSTTGNVAINPKAGTGTVFINQASTNPSIALAIGNGNAFTVTGQGQVGFNSSASPSAQFVNSVTPIALNQTGTHVQSQNSLATGIRYSGYASYGDYVYLVGGFENSVTAAVYYAKVNPDGTVGPWIATSSLPATRYLNQAVAYNGYLYSLGGHSGATTQSTVYYAKINSNGTLQPWASTSSLGAARQSGAAVAYDGYIYYLGGSDTGDEYSTTYVASINNDGSLGSFTTSTALSYERYNHVAVAHNGYVYIAGGLNSTSTVQDTVESATLTNGTIGSWSATNDMPAARNHPAATIHNGRMIVTGGSSTTVATGVQDDVYFGTLNSGVATWITANELLGASRFRHMTAAVNGFLITYGGENSGGTRQSTVYSAPLQSSAFAFNTGSTFNQGNLLDLWNGNTSKFAIDYAGNIIASAGAVFKPNVDATNAFGIATANGTSYVNFDSINQRLGVGTITPTAKLDVNGTASISGALKLYGTPTIQSTNGQTLTIGGGTSGNLALGQSGKTIELPGYAGSYGLLYANGGIISQVGAGSTGQCLTGNTSAAPTWGSCDAASSVNVFEFGSGTARTTNQTVDLLVGGISTTSAKFAITGVNTDTPVASVSAMASGLGISIGYDGALQTTLNQTLTIGGSTTGNIAIQPNQDTGDYIVISSDGTDLSLTTTDSSNLTINPAGTLQFYSSANSIDSSGNLTLAGNIDLANGNYIGLNGSNSQISFTEAGTFDSIDISNSNLAMAGGNFTHTASGNPTLASTYTSPDSVEMNDIVIVGNYAYLTSAKATDSNFEIVDITNPSSPNLVGKMLLDDTNYGGLAIAGNYAYVGITASWHGTAGLEVIDISNPSNPVKVSMFEGINDIRDIYISGKYAYVATVDSTNKLAILDISDPTDIKFIGGANAPYYASGIYVQDNYAYLTVGSSGIAIYDVSNPVNPILRGQYDTGWADDVVVSGKYAYVADGSNGLVILDISNPYSPSLVDQIGSTAGADVKLAGNYAYLANYSTGLTVVDVTDPTSISVIGSYNTPGSAIGLDVVGKYAYVADATSGMAIVDINGISTPSLFAGAIQSGILSVTTDGTVGNNLYVGNGLNIGSGGLFSNGSFSFISASGSGNLIQGNPTGKALLSLNQTGAEDIFTASASGVTKFTIKNDGTASSSAGFTINGAGNIQSTNNQTLTIGGGTSGNLTLGQSGKNISLPGYATDWGLLYTTGGVLTQVGAGSTGQCLLSNTGAAPSWGSCDGASSVNVWDAANGIITQGNITQDFLLGGSATSSAKFAVLNMNGTGPATASISGNLIVMPHNGAGGLLGIGVNNPTQQLEVLGNTFLEGRVAIGANIESFDPRIGVNINNADLSTAPSDSSESSLGLLVAQKYTFASPAFETNNYGEAIYTHSQITGGGSYTNLTGLKVEASSREDGLSNIGVRSTAWNFEGHITNSYGGYFESITEDWENGDGSTTNAYGVYSHIKLNEYFTTDPFITNGYGLYSDCNDASTCYGLYVEAGDADVTTDWGIYVNGEDKNYISGLLGIGTPNPIASLHIHGGNQGGNALGIFNQTGSFSNDIFTASASGTTRFTIGNAGQIGLGLSAGVPDFGSNGECLLSQGVGSGAVWGSCDSASSVNVWEQISGTAQLTNTTLDLLVGGISTASAKFAITNVVGARGQQTASLSGSLVLDAAGSLQTTNNQTLTLGGGSTGDLVIGRTSQAVYLPGFTTNQNSILYTGASGLLTAATTTNDGYCLKSSSGGTPSWGPCDGASSVNVWDAANGIITQGNITQDFLLGGTSTASAKFAVLNLNGSGPATATVSGDLIVMPRNGAGGKVGIGTDNPTAKLTLAGGNFIHTANGDPVSVGNISTSADTFDVEVSGKYAYMADGTTGLRIIDVSNPASPVALGTYDSTLAYGVAVSGKYAYIADDTSGLVIVDITNPNAPTFAGQWDNPSGNSFGVAVSGSYAYLADGSAGLRIINISNPATPFLVGTLNTADSAEEVAVQGDYAYISDGASGLYVIDISNPYAPTTTDTYNPIGSGNSDGIYVSGKYAYLGDQNTGLSIINISDPTNITLTATISPDNSMYGSFVAGNYIYITDGTAGVQVYDISNQSSPVKVGTYNTPSFAWSITVSGKYAYVADSMGGLRILDINGVSTPSISTGSLFANALNVSENLSIGGYASFTSGITVGNGGILSSGPLSVYSGTGTFNSIQGASSGNALLVINQQSSQDIFTASSSGVTKFVINNNGQIGINAGNNNSTLLSTLDVRANSVNGGTVSVASVSGATSHAGLVVDNSGSGDIFTASSSGLTRFTIKQSGVVQIGNDTNGIVFDYLNGGTRYVGNSRPSKALVFTPEYAGGVLTASGSATTIGTMTSDASPSAALSNFRTYYEWTSSQTSLQDYTVAVRVKLPADFSSWASTNAVTVSYNTELTTNDSQKLNVLIYNADTSLSSTEQATPVVYRQNAVSASQKTWLDLSIDDSNLDSGGNSDIDSAGETMIIYLKLFSKDNNHIQIGDITLNYLSAF